MPVLQRYSDRGQDSGRYGTVLSPYRESTKSTAQMLSPGLRHWLWTELGIDVYEWGEDEIRF